MHDIVNTEIPEAAQRLMDKFDAKNEKLVLDILAIKSGILDEV